MCVCVCVCVCGSVHKDNCLLSIGMNCEVYRGGLNKRFIDVTSREAKFSGGGLE